jgi:carbonic anhydrase/acetyltransferase-like protein (isoleucine patch superfamily)
MSAPLPKGYMKAFARSKESDPNPMTNATRIVRNDEVMYIGGQTYRRHCNGGGWVCKWATVSSHAFVGCDAMVRDEAVVSAGVIIEDFAVVSGKAFIDTGSVIRGFAVVSGRASVRSASVIGENAFMTDSAQILDDSQIRGDVVVSGDAVVEGNSYIDGLVWTTGTSEEDREKNLYSLSKSRVWFLGHRKSTRDFFLDDR